MGKKNGVKDKESKEELRKPKEVCCEKHLKKGKRCKDCPEAALGTRAD